jgi:phenylpyruvate tautomerase PptA (4-oxalocrotonate tautomerase family)
VPLYTVTTQAGVFDAKGRSQFAEKITQLHCEVSGVPKNWVHIIFQEFPGGSGFTGGVPAATGSLTVLIRKGRTAVYKRELLQHLWQLLQAATGAPDDQLVIGIQEVPPSQAMEMGQVMPEVAGE